MQSATKLWLVNKNNCLSWLLPLRQPEMRSESQVEKIIRHTIRMHNVGVTMLKLMGFSCLTSATKSP
jgi:hypothetical protein